MQIYKETTMKIRVTLDIKTNTEADSVVDLVARPGDTVASVKEKVAGKKLIPFPDQELLFDGKVLANESKLATCGIGEGSSLKFKFKATEATLAEQFVELLKDKDLTSDELGMLYCYKHGASVSQALKFLGFEGSLQEFIGREKSLSMDNGSISAVKKEESVKPFAVTDEVVQILQDSETGTLDINSLCAKFLQKFGVNLSSYVGSRPIEFLSKEKGAFEVHGRFSSTGVLVSLPGARNRVPPPPGLSLPPGPQGFSWEDAGDEKELPPMGLEQFEELHGKIHSRSFNADVSKTLNDVVAALSEEIFLEVDHVVIGGSIGNGTATTVDATAEVVLFLEALPTTGHEAWQAPLLNSVVAVLADDFQTANGIESLQVVDGCIKMCVNGPYPIVVDLHFSPAYEGYKNTVDVLKKQGEDARKFYSPSFAKERMQFVARQPSAIKQTIRLMKWWRDQQVWYGPHSRPSDDLLELSASYSAMKTKPADQKEAIANLMSLLSRFNEMRVVWADNYTKDDVWAPLLTQRPLLMDPTNPFVNVADSSTFDATELMILAKTTHFFW